MTKSEIRFMVIVELFWAMVCLVVAGFFWGYVFIEVDKAFIKSHEGEWFAIIFLLVINLSHCCWGFFHTSEDISKASAEAKRGPFKRGLWEYDRIRIRIVAFLTIGFSVYVQRAVEWARMKSE